MFTERENTQVSDRDVCEIESDENSYSIQARQGVER